MKNNLLARKDKINKTKESGATLVVEEEKKLIKKSEL
jgi:hypothetical protein